MSGTDLSSLPRGRLEAMLDGGAAVLRSQAALSRGGGNIVSAILDGQPGFYAEQHYPPGDAFDPTTGSQYYYHAHSAANPVDGEHGHFHTFLREGGIPPELRPLPQNGQPPPGQEGLSHLVAISMDRFGQPVRLFTVNRWVTGETWYAAREVILMLDHFVVREGYPLPALNEWISGMVRLFRPEIIDLIQQRDIVLATSAAANPLEDRSLEVMAALDISVERQIRRVRRALGGQPLNL